MSVDGIPEARDDDPEDVADKLGIAQAMWARGERGDALSWLRRAAEAASDAEVDMRALELAKAASALAPLVAMQTAPAQPGNAAVKPAATKPTAAAKPAAAAPKPQTQPPKAAALPTARLGALPPLRPLGQAPPNAPAKNVPSRPATLPSTPAAIVAAAGQFPPRAAVKPDAKPAPPSSRPPVDDRATMEPVTADFDDDGHDEEATHQIQLPATRPESDFESTATHQVVDMAYLRGVSKVEKVVEPPPPESDPSFAISIATSEPPRTTLEPVALPLAVGVRVRIRVDNGQLVVTPDRDPTGPATNDAGTAAILSPLHPDDDLRSLFYLVR